MTPCWVVMLFWSFLCRSVKQKNSQNRWNRECQKATHNPLGKKMFKMVHTNNINKCKYIQNMFKIISVYPTTEAIILQTMGTLNDGTWGSDKWLGIFNKMNGNLSPFGALNPSLCSFTTWGHLQRMVKRNISRVWIGRNWSWMQLPNLFKYSFIAGNGLIAIILREMPRPNHKWNR